MSDMPKTKTVYTDMLTSEEVGFHMDNYNDEIIENIGTKEDYEQRISDNGLKYKRLSVQQPNNVLEQMKWIHTYLVALASSEDVALMWVAKEIEKNYPKVLE